MDADVVVIGGGIAGLTAGALVAQAGRKVLVLERRPVVGGRALVVHQGGFTLNYGYHFVLGADASPHARVFRRLGLRLEARPTWGAGYARVRGGRLKRFPTSPAATWQFFGARNAWAYAASGLRFLREPATPLLAQPLDAWLDRQRVPADVALWLLDISRAIGFLHQPGAFSAGHFVDFMRLSFRQQRRPSLILPWDRMFADLERYIQTRGGQVRCRVRVDAVVVEGGRAVGVRAGGESIPARAVIVAIPPQQATALVPGGVRWDGGRPASELEPTTGLVLDLGVEGTWDRPWIAVDDADKGIVIARHSHVDPRLAPPGHTLLQAIRFLPPEELTGARLEAHKAEMLATIDAIYPGATRRIVLQRCLVPPMLTAAAHTAAQPWQVLPPVQSPEIPNLLFCGDGYRAPGELSNPAVESAEEAARAASLCT